MRVKVELIRSTHYYIVNHIGDTTKYIQNISTLLNHRKQEMSVGVGCCHGVWFCGDGVAYKELLYYIIYDPCKEILCWMSDLKEGIFSVYVLYVQELH